MNKHTLIFAALAAVIASSAHAATITVTGTTPTSCTLARAVALANALDVTVDPPCVRLNDTSGSEDLVDTIVFAPGVTTVVPAGNTLSLKTPMVIDGGGRIILESTVQQRIFEVAVLASETVTLTGITLRGTLTPSGGIRVKTGKLVVTLSTFEANKATFGGAMHVDPGATVEVSDSTFIDNEASGTIAITVPPPVPTCGQLPVVLGSTSNFAVLAGSTITSTSTVLNPTIINGDIGLSPGTAVTGFGPGIVDGDILTGTDPIAAQAKLDLTTAYNDAKGRSLCSVTITGNLGGLTLAPGLYHSETFLEITTGNLTLDAQGDPNAVWIFQMGSSFTTTPGRQIILAGGAQAANIFWQVGSSATIGTNNIFYGTIMADQSVTLNTGTHLIGRALARIAAVTLDTNLVDIPATAGPAGGSGDSGETGSGIGGPEGVGFGVEGGAVDCFGTCSFDRVLFANNLASGTSSAGSAFGGAIMAFNATLKVVNSTFVGNEALAGTTALTANPAAARGGAIAASGGTLVVDFATFSGNSATRALTDTRALTSGGALYLLPALVDYQLFAALFSGNDAALGGDCDRTGNLVTAESLFETIADRNDCAGTAVTNVVGPAGLLPLADNGGATDTMRFANSSSALNHIAAAACTRAGGVDQRGYVRPSVGACDIGALELENLSLSITGPTSHATPPGATTPQTVTMAWSIASTAPVAALGFDVEVSPGVTANIYDADGVLVPGCVFDGIDTTSCSLGDVAAGVISGEIDFVFAAARIDPIAWSGVISYGFSDALLSDDSAAGVILITSCVATAAVDTTCNGVDDNCNGATDEGFVSAANTCGVGACAATGVTTCVAGIAGSSCVAGTPALTDGTCNGVDNDCDGQTDEGFAPVANTCGVGACSAVGTTTCTGGVTGSSCVVGTAAASDATCNGVDNDCNGATDEDVVAVAATCGVGACAASGVTTCVAGVAGSTCVAGTPSPIDNDCDGVDDDCDGGTDEGFAPVSRICGDSCAGGAAITTCVAGRRVESACVPAADGAVCIDSGPCTLAAACQAGECTVTRSRSCNDSNPCTADRCDDLTGCVSTPLGNGSSCDDGNPCTTTDACQAGICAGPALACAAPTDCEEQGICNVATGVCDYAFIDGCDPGCEPGADTTRPTMVCPIGKNAECTNGGNAVVVGTATARDACGAVTITSDASVIYPLGETVVTFTGRDVAGNTATCTTLVTVADNDAPLVTCPADATVAGDRLTCDGVVTLTQPTASDACDGDGVTVVGPPLDVRFAPGTTVNTWFAIDAAGNQAECSTRVTVTGIDGFTIDCAPTLTVNASADVCGWPEVITANLVRGCGEAATLESATTLFPVGNSDVDFSAEEGGQSATCRTVLTVVDASLPVVACGERAERTDGSIAYMPTSTDACGATVRVSQARCERDGVEVLGRCEIGTSSDSLEVFDAAIGSQTSVDVVWTVTASDPSGNSATLECRTTLEPTNSSLFETGGGGCAGGGPAALGGALAGLALLGLRARRRKVAEVAG